MSEQALDDVGFSLADLANLNLEEIEAVRFENMPKGVYEFEVNRTAMSNDPKDGEPRYKIEFELKVVEMLSTIEAGVDLDKWAGKIQMERFFIYPKRDIDDVAKAIGRVKAFLEDMGAPLVKDAEGKMKLGPTVEGAKGHVFKARLEHQKDKNDPDRVYARLRLEAAN